MDLSSAPFYFPALAAMFGSPLQDSIELLDVVRLTAPVELEDGSTLPTGAHGAVVAVLKTPTPSYEVEFPGRDGRTLALLTLSAEQVQLA